MTTITAKLSKIDPAHPADYSGHTVLVRINQHVDLNGVVQWLAAADQTEAVSPAGDVSLTLPEPASPAAQIIEWLVTLQVLSPDQAVLISSSYSITPDSSGDLVIVELHPDGPRLLAAIEIPVDPRPAGPTVVQGRLQNSKDPGFDYSGYRVTAAYAKQGTPAQQAAAVARDGLFTVEIPSVGQLDQRQFSLAVRDPGDLVVFEPPPYQVDDLTEGHFLDLNIDVAGRFLVDGQLLRPGETAPLPNEQDYENHRIQAVFSHNEGTDAAPKWVIKNELFTTDPTGRFTLSLPDETTIGNAVTLQLLGPAPDEQILEAISVLVVDLLAGSQPQLTAQPAARQVTTVDGQLVRSTDSSPEDRENECQYEDHYLLLSYPYAARTIEPQIVPVRQNGEFTLTVLADQQARFQLAIYAPDDDLLLRQDYQVIIQNQTALLLPHGRRPAPDHTNELEIDPKKPAITPRNDDPYLQKLLERRSFKVTGAVLDDSGSHTVINKQVLIWARLEGADCEDFKLILAARTDAHGYFSGDYPYDLRYQSHTFIEAYGVVGIGQGVQAPIRLDANGHLPEKIILVVEVPDGALADEEECGCNAPVPRAPDHIDFANSIGTYSDDLEGGTCVSFTAPNRTLEEFSYYSVVRTTDPQLIRGEADPDTSLAWRKGRVVPERIEMNAAGPVDWDNTPTYYQATTIAHGHMLHFKQVWKADGYSMGDLLYSLPLAPCQKKQIAVIDWERRESATRFESTRAIDALQAVVSRDRDISEITRGALSEQVEGRSKAGSGSVGGGLGFGFVGKAIGGFLGIGGGSSKASSSAWQSSSRRMSTNMLHRLRDSTMQAASSVRDQRSTVIQTVRQGETVQAQTEVVSNHNHCHAITIQYFEVLRHFLVTQELVDVQECLFIPLLMSRFSRGKAMRWREQLSAYLRDRSLRRGFTAIEQLELGSSNLPSGRQADQPLQDLEGELAITFNIARPKDKDDAFDPDAWGFWGKLFGGNIEDRYNRFLQGQQQKDRIFQEQFAPQIAEFIVRQLRFYAIHGRSRVRLPIDPTLVSEYRPNGTLFITLRLDADLPSLTRAEVEYVEIDAATSFGNIIDLLPANSKLVVERGSLRYRTNTLSGYLFQDASINNDLTSRDNVRISAYPLSRQELHNPRAEYEAAAEQLIDHLNEHLEYYHQAIWLGMDRERRYMLLDGFKAPNAPNKSLASVVENRLLGIVGNCLVMPVAPGFKLDPTYCQNNVDNPTDLLNLYAPTTPIDPMRISVPTRGVFAEAVMGSCNSCEKKDDTRFWRFEESPCGNEPTPIEPVSTDSRVTDPPDTTPTPFPTPIINLQNAPAAPDPGSLNGILQLLGASNLFNDITGLDQNQRNALAALTASLGTAQTFGLGAAQLAGGGSLKEISKLAQQGALMKDIDKALQTIQSAREQGLIEPAQAKSLANSALQGLVGEDRPPQSHLTDEPAVQRLLDTAGQDNQSEIAVNRFGGDSGSVQVKRGQTTPPPPAIDIRYEAPLIPQQTGYSCWAAGAAMLVAWRDQVSIDPEAIANAVGYWQQYQQGLHPEDTTMFAVWGLTPEPAQTYTVEGFAELLQRYGPLWVASAEPGPHIRVVTGLRGDGTASGATLFINDPWDIGKATFSLPNAGAQYSESYTQFERKQRTLALRESNLEGIYVAHL